MLIAIVGSRTCSGPEAQAAYRLSYALAQSGVTVVSGLAKGIDSAALTAVVDTQAAGIAVLPTAPCERIYPPGNAVLAQRLCALGGLVLTPYATPCDAPWRLKRRLIERNLLMAVACDICVVVADKDVGDGGTAWMVAFCHRLGKPVLRLDSAGRLHAQAPRVRRALSWVPELVLLKEYIRLRSL